MLADTLRVGRRVAAEARNVPQTIALVWSATHRWTTAWLALLVVQGALPAAAVYLTKSVVDGLLRAIEGQAGTAAIPEVLGTIAPLAVVMLLQPIAGSLLRWVRFHQSELLQDHISRLIHEKSVSVRLSFYDFPEYFDRLHRARDEASYRAVALVDVTGALLRNAITSIGVAALLVPYGVWLPLALIIGSTPSVLLVLRNSLRRQEWRNRSTAQFRKAAYFEHLLTSREAAAEVRLFSLGARVIDAYQALRRGLVEEQSDLLRREALTELLAAILSMAVAGAAAAWILWEALSGRLSPGSVALFLAAFVQAQSLMRTLLDNAGQLYANSLFLGDLFAFLRLEAEPVCQTTPAVMPPLRHGIRFDEVDFTYPDTDRKALSRFSLEVPAGRTVAIVGPNGAGKSTIIKLLCRFYEPSAGRILIEEQDIAASPAPEVRELISVLFQDPVKYCAPVTENVEPVPGRASRERIEAALHAAGAERIVAGLPHGADTLLGKWFANGVELSGGEWQRLALARAFARTAPILLLDEPTSAMDSWAEGEWFDRFRRVAAGRTTIIITHRFTTAMQADVIHVMDAGRIVESGTHEQLLAMGGRYAVSWHAQTGERVSVLT